VGTWLVYPAIFPLIAEHLGSCVAMVGIIPPLFVAWTFGLALGLVAAIVTFPLNTALMALTFADFQAWLFSPAHLVGHGCLLLLCAVVGRSSDMRHRLQAERAQRRATAAALKKNEAQTDAILDTLPDLALLVDHKGQISRFHSAVPANFPLPLDQVSGRSLVEFFEGEVAAKLDEALGRVAQTGEKQTLELQAANQLGNDRDYEATLSRSAKGLTVLMRDITEKKDLERKRAEVERIAREEAQLKSIFLANMSHEIRTPLNAIMGLTNLLLDTSLSEEQREQLQVIHASGDTLLRVINDVLDYSKIEAGKLDMEMIDFDLRATVEDAVELFALAARRKGLDLSVVYSSQTPQWVQGDPTRISQLLNNTLSNAMKFADKGEVALEVTPLTKADASGNGTWTVQFQVRDTGIGIPKDRQHAVFDMFSQLDSSMTRRHGGTGLGLTICRQLVEIMKGKIAVTSTVGEGTTFSFSIPFQPTDEQHHSTSPMSIDVAGRRALCLEHQPSHQRELKHNLAALGIDLTVVHQADDVRQALEGEGIYDFDVVIANAELLDDQPLLPIPKQQSDAVDTPPLVVLASTTTADDADRARQAGASAYLLRPVRFRKFRECLLVVFGLEREDEYTLITQHRLPSFDLRIPAKILLVEDNLINRKVAVKMLGKLGCSVVTAAHGREAHTALLAESFDLVLMDCQMPVMDGFQATELIRSDRRIDRRVPIIALTAHAMKGDRERCIAAGMNDYLTKPIDLKELERVLQRFCKSKLPPPPSPRESQLLPSEKS
jgi:PAS domain S-box-containing protein